MERERGEVGNEEEEEEEEQEAWGGLGFARDSTVHTTGKEIMVSVNAVWLRVDNILTK